MSTMSELLLSISHCEEVEKALNDSNHECHEIVSFQKEEKRHLPEPWNGDINTADILFISSNPSYCDEETTFPNKHSDNDYIVNFFLTRFERSDYNTNFVIGIKKCASWLLNISDPAIFKKKICCTNIVHCKSTDEIGVNDSTCEICSEKWLTKVLQEFHGEYIFVIGRIAQKMFDKDMLKHCPNVKKVLFVPHPSGWRYRYSDKIIKENIVKALNSKDVFSECYQR